MRNTWMTILGIAAVSTVAIAQGPPEGRRQGGQPNALRDRMAAAWEAVDKGECFKALDNDGDGVVTQEEFERADLQEIFGAALFKAMRQRPAGAQGQGKGDFFKRMDKNGDGKISAEEFPRGPEAFERFAKRADTDGDGLVSKEEMQAMRANAAKRQGKKRQKDNGDGE